MADVLRMTPAAVDIHYHQGDIFAQQFEFTVDGEPLDITGWVIEAAVQPQDGARIALTVNVTDAAAGEFEVTGVPGLLNPAAPGGSHYWDLRRADSSQTIVSGRLVVQADRVQ